MIKLILILLILFTLKLLLLGSSFIKFSNHACIIYNIYIIKRLASHTYCKNNFIDCIFSNKIFKKKDTF